MHLRDAVSDPGDPYMIAWTLWWDYHQTFHDPLHLFKLPRAAGADGQVPVEGGCHLRADLAVVLQKGRQHIPDASAQARLPSSTARLTRRIMCWAK